MNTPERNALLMETDGLDSSETARRLSKALKSSSLYATSKERLRKASESKRPSVMAAYMESRDLDFSVATMKEYARLETQVLLLAAKALPEWWANPLDASSKPESSLTSVGQLWAQSDGTALTIDELILSEETSDREKADILTRRVDFYRKDAEQKASNAFEEFRHGEEGKTLSPFKGIRQALTFALLLLGNGYALALLAIPSQQVKDAFFRPDFSALPAYAVYLVLIGAFAYDVLYVAQAIVFSRQNAVLDYAAKFAKAKSESYLKALDQAAQALLKDLLSAVKAHRPMPANSFGKYGSDLEGQMDLEAVIRSQEAKRNHRHGFLNALFLSYSWLFVFMVAFSVVVLIVLAQKGTLA